MLVTCQLSCDVSDLDDERVVPRHFRFGGRPADGCRGPTMVEKGLLPNAGAGLIKYTIGGSITPKIDTQINKIEITILENTTTGNQMTQKTFVGLLRVRALPR